MNRLPLVSILIPTYNQPEFFRQALSSAIAQDYPNIEILVSDDSTDDRVRKIFDTYRRSGRPMLYLKHGNQSKDLLPTEKTALNIENLLSHAQGDFINILFHDDLIYPTKISRMMEYFFRDDADQIAIVTSRREAIQEDGIRVDFDDFSIRSKLGHGDAFLPSEEIGRTMLMLCVNYIGELSAVLMRRSDFYRDCVRKLSGKYFLGIYDRTLGDVSTFLEACKNDRGVVFINEPLSAFRIGSEFQNSVNGLVRMNIVVDWLSFITAAYLCDVYLHTFEDFSYACENWLSRVASTIFKSTAGVSTFNETPPADFLEDLIRSIESVSDQNFELTLQLGIDWIRKYSSKTFDVDKYIEKKFGGG